MSQEKAQSFKSKDFEPYENTGHTLAIISLVLWVPLLLLFNISGLPIFSNFTWFLLLPPALSVLAIYKENPRKFAIISLVLNLVLPVVVVALFLFIMIALMQI